MPLTVKGKNGAAAPAEEVATKTNAVVQAEQTVAPANQENLGKLSDKLKFVAPLGDPSQDDVTYFDKPDGTKGKKVDPIIVGYRFVADVDLDIPDVKPGEDFKKNLMSYTGDPSATRKVKAGETFDLTKFETGLLISREEFNGKATGGQIPVTCSYATNRKVAGNGAVAKTLSQSAIPSIALRATTGSIKDVAIIPVLEFTTSEDPVTKAKRKHRKVLAGFEKFQPLCKDYVSTAVRAGGSASAAEKRNAGAAAFLQIAMSKKA